MIARHDRIFDFSFLIFDCDWLDEIKDLKSKIENAGFNIYDIARTGK